MPSGGALTLALAADGQRWVYGRDDGGLVLRDAAGAQRSLPPAEGNKAGSPLLECRAPAPARAVQQANRSRGAAARSDDGAGAEHGIAVRALATGNDGRRFFTAHDDGTLRHWDIDKGSTFALRAAGCGLTALAVGGGPDNATRLAVASLDNRVLLLDGNGRRLADWRVDAARDGSIRALALDHSGKWLAVATADRRLRLIDTRSQGKPGGDDGLTVTGVVDQLTALAFSPDGHWLVSGSSEGYVRLWNVADRSAFGKPQPAHSREVAAIVFSADGRRFQLSTLGGALREWPAPDVWAEFDVRQARPQPQPQGMARTHLVRTALPVPVPGPPSAARCSRRVARTVHGGGALKQRQSTISTRRSH